MNVALRPEPLNIISLCTGGAGLDLGVELAIPEARTVCMVEREAFPVATLVSAMEAGSLHPAPIWSNARTFDGRVWRGVVDGLIGGIPCQPHSLAGKRLGREDERDLWSTARRIFVQSGAWFVLIENVHGMLSSGGAERVWRDLHRLGCKVEGGLFTAAEVGDSQERERLFILAVLDDAAGRRERRDAGSAPCPPHAAGPRQAHGRDGSPEYSGEAMADAEPSGRQGWRPSLVGAGAALPSGEAMDDALGRGWPAGRDDHRRHERHEPDATGKYALFPPRPDDFEGWRSALSAAPELEPAFRRVADGLASRLDIGRVDRLRMLGNGVVPLQAAYALRTLATRLAARGSAGAARLVRLMEAAE